LLNTLSGVMSERCPSSRQGSTHQGCSSGESLAMCGRFNKKYSVWI